MNRDGVVAVVQTYLVDGLLKQDVDKVLLADDCTRTEQGFKTCASGTHIREVLLMDNLEMNEAIENDRWIVEGNMASVWYDLILTGVLFPIRVAATLELADGLIGRHGRRRPDPQRLRGRSRRNGVTLIEEAVMNSSDDMHANRSAHTKQIVAGAVTLLVILLVFVGVFPQFADYGEAWDAVKRMSTLFLLTLLAATVVDVVVYVWPFQAPLPGLSYAKAFVVRHTSFMISNVVPAGGAGGLGVQ